MSHATTSRSERARRRKRQSVAASTLIAGLLLGALVAASPAGAALRSTHPSSKRPGDYRFNAPDAAAVAGADLFVANRMGNSITEVRASNGAFVRLIEGSRYRFDEPSALLVLGKDLFVANAKAGVTELAISNGALVRTFRGARYFSGAVALATDGSNVYVLNAGGSGSVTKLAAGTGKMSVAKFRFDVPTAIVSVGTELFVTNSRGNSVTEIDATTMTSNTLKASRYQFEEPTGMAVDGGAVWITNYLGPTVTVISASTGELVKVVPDMDGNLPNPGPIIFADGNFYAASPPGSSPMITRVQPGNTVMMPWMMCNTNGPYEFSNPQALAVAGSTLWVVNEGGLNAPYGPSLTEMNASSGALIRTIS
jgi:DNA-binding beta-propeller fold protein YncE